MTRTVTSAKVAMPSTTERPANASASANVGATSIRPGSHTPLVLVNVHSYLIVTLTDSFGTDKPVNVNVRLKIVARKNHTTKKHADANANAKDALSDRSKTRTPVCAKSQPSHLLTKSTHLS